MSKKTVGKKPVAEKTKINVCPPSRTIKEKTFDVIEQTKEFEFLQKENPTYADVPVLHQQAIPVCETVFEPVVVRSVSPVLEFEKLCGIYSAVLGAGNDKIFLVSKKKVEPTEQMLCMKKIDWETFDKNYLNGADFEPSPKLFGLRDSNIFESEGEEKRRLSWQEIIDENIIWLFEVVPAVDLKIAVHFAKTYGFGKLIDDYFSENAKIDDKIKFAFEHLLVNCSDASPEFQRYSGHQILITNTKTGKSTLAEKLTLKYDSASSARLLGFSTADRTSIGDLQHQYKPVTLDDVSNTTFPDTLLDAFPAVLENGLSTIGKGKQTLKIKTSSAFTLTTNLMGSDEPDNLMMEFYKTITQLSKMQQRIGSRFGLILFSDKLLPVRDGEYKLSKQDISNNKILVDVLFNRINEIFAELLQQEEIQQWLNTPLENYKKSIKHLLEKSYLMKEINDFWTSHTESYRHIRGVAVRHALIEFLKGKAEILISHYDDVKKIVEKEIMPKHDEVLGFCEDGLERVCQINLESLRSMIDVSVDISEFYKIQFESIRQNYIKVLLMALGNKEFDEDMPKLIPIEMLENEIREASEKMGEKRYATISQIMQGLVNKRFNSVSSIFGVEIITQKESLFFHIIDKQALQNLCNFCKMCNSCKENKEEIHKITGNYIKPNNENNENNSQIEANNKENIHKLQELHKCSFPDCQTQTELKTPLGAPVCLKHLKQQAEMLFASGSKQELPFSDFIAIVTPEADKKMLKDEFWIKQPHGERMLHVNAKDNYS